VSPAHARRSPSARGRVWIVSLVVAVMAAGAALDRHVGASHPGLPPAPSPTRIAADAAASSSLTCGGIGSNGNFVASANIQITNSASTPRTVTALVVSNAASSVTAAPFTVSPGSSWGFNPAHVLAKGSWLSVRLLVNGGGVSAVMVPTSGRSATITPCTSEVSKHWYFAGGSTIHGDQIDYTIVNPTATPAVVNMTMLSDSGVLSPQNAQGLLVPAESEYVVSGLREAPNVRDLAASFKAEQGAVVIFATQLRPRTLSSTIMPGQAELYGQAFMAHASHDPVSMQVLSVANPTPKATTVTVSVHTPYGRTAPWKQTMPAFSTWNLDLTGSSQIPLTSPFALTVTSVGSKISAEFTTLAIHAAQAGLSMVSLSPMLAASSLMPAWGGSLLSELSLFNPGSKATTATIRATRFARGHRIVVPSGAMLAVPSTTLRPFATHPFTVSGPVIVGGSYAGGVLPSLGSFTALAKN